MTTHTRCPKCAQRGADRAGDNLAVYPGGGAHCFACGFHQHPPNSLANMKARMIHKQPDNGSMLNDYYNSSGLTPDLPIHALRWLARYQVGHDDARRHNFTYCRDRDTLCMPTYDGMGELAHLEERYLGESISYPKYKSFGSKTAYFKMFSPIVPTGEWLRVVVLVEDTLSSIRVGRVCACIPLHGTHIPNELVNLLHTMKDPVRVWLDRDAAQKGAKAVLGMSQFIPDVRSIITALDPKEYNQEAIVDFVKGSL